MGLIGETLIIAAGAIFVALFTRAIYVLIHTSYVNDFIARSWQKKANKMFDKAKVQHRDGDNT